jgi:PAS domain S-box-containing protein
MQPHSLNELFLDAIITKTPGLIGLFDPEKREFLLVNQRGLELFDVPDKITFSHHFEERLLRKHPLSPKKLKDREDSIRHHGFYVEEDEFLRFDGTTFWGMEEIHLLEQNEKTYYFIRIIDTQEHHKSESDIKYQTDRLEALFDNATMGIIMTDETGTVISANRYGEQLFGYELGEILNLKVEDLLPDALRQQHEQYRMSYMTHPQKRAMGVGLDLLARKKNGDFFPVEISLGHFRNEGKLYVVAFVVDITFKKQAEKEIIRRKEEIEKLNSILEEKVTERTKALLDTLHQLEKSQKDLAEAFTREKELNELKSRFVSMASHEFRTPLSGILSSVSLIKKYITTEEQEKREKHIRRIEDSVNQLTDILEEFLSVSKLEEGKVETRITQISLPDLIGETLADLRMIAKKGQRLTFQHTGNPDIYIDKSLLKKTLINLVSNAIKFSPEGATIEVTGLRHNDFLELTVKDEGIGISEEDQRHLFERFFRGSNASDIQGTGLGLHIVAKYVDLMKGKIFVKSQLNQGTTFTLLFNHAYFSQNKSETIKAKY